MPGQKILICVVGPTAIGKTAMAVSLAQAFDTHVISADSRQFYREMAIGTAVPTQAEMKGVPHHFVQHISIQQLYNAGNFEKDALKKLEQLFTDRDFVVMAGGSGLYVDAVVRGLDELPNIPEQVREDLRAQLEENGLKALLNELQKVDPEAFARLDLDNSHRVLRALEVYRSSGRPISSFWDQEKPKRDFKTIFIGLWAPRPTVYSRIEQRVDQMMQAGLEEEARKLYGYRELGALQTVGYRELFRYFDGELTLQEAVSEIKKNSRRYAKRQGTWFRKNPSINWFDYDAAPSEITVFIKKGGITPPVNT